MKFLLDTNICIYIIIKRPAEVITRFKNYEPEEMGISAITVSELQYGVSRSIRNEENQVRLNSFLTPFGILPYDEKAAFFYGTIRAGLEREGNPIGPLDLLIGAQALSRDLVLITNNEREFERIRGLEVRNWAAS